VSLVGFRVLGFVTSLGEVFLINGTLSQSQCEGPLPSHVVGIRPHVLARVRALVHAAPRVAIAAPPSSCCCLPRLLLLPSKAAASCLPGMLPHREEPEGTQGAPRKRRLRGPWTTRRPHLVSGQGRCGMRWPLGPSASCLAAPPPPPLFHLTTKLREPEQIRLAFLMKIPRAGLTAASTRAGHAFCAVCGSRGGDQPHSKGPGHREGDVRRCTFRLRRVFARA